MPRLYTITGQLQIRANINGRLDDVYEISYAGPGNIEGQVRLPVASATPDAVDAAIRARLENQRGIAALGDNGA